MSKYFGFVEGEAHDFKFKKHHYDNWTNFYLGPHFICTLIRHDYKPGWGVIVDNVEDREQTPTLVEGFVSRRAAIDYALKVHTKTCDQYHDARKQSQPQLFHKTMKQALQKYGDASEEHY